jgi:hypothetical protein
VKTLNPWVEVLPSGFRKTFSVLFEHFPVVTGRGTPRGHRGPFHAEPASFAALRGYGAAGRLLRPPVSSPARFHRLPRLLRRPRRSVRPFGVELASALRLVFDDGLHDFTVFTTTYGLHDFPSPLSIPIVATLQRLEGVAVDVLTSRTWFCRSSLRAV